MDDLDAELFGPQELAAFYKVSPSLIAQWRRRDKLPPAWRVISGVPIWRYVDICQHQPTSKGAEK
jgi:hypothetical protein